jgi:hypothetical protein
LFIVYEIQLINSVYVDYVIDLVRMWLAKKFNFTDLASQIFRGEKLVSG